MRSTLGQTASMGDTELVYSVWVTAKPAADLPGKWVVHCLDFDVVSQGDSLEHAMMMIAEAASIVLVEDLKSHRDPLARRAPESEFEEMWEMVRSGDRVTHDVAFADLTGTYVYAFPAELRVPRASVSGTKPSIASTRRVPVVAFAKKRTA